MNTTFYHASNGGLKELLPLSNLRGNNEVVCYFTPVRAYALFYLRDMEVNHVTCGVQDNGTVVYHEQFPNQLEVTYKSRSGYLYACENNNNIIMAHTNGVYMAKQAIAPSGEEYIEDVYTEIMKAAEDSTVQIIRFESLSDEKKQEITAMMKGYILKSNLLTADTPKSRFFKINFPTAWENAEQSLLIPVINHYDALIDENNDPVHDPDAAKAYMDKWDGQAFISELQLSTDKSVLEIGVGTGRLAMRVCDKCGNFTGIDISPKTITRAKENLREFPNVRLICGDFLTYQFDKTYDLIYSSLTFMHIQDKCAAIKKVAELLERGGRFVLSISKNQQSELDFGNRHVIVHPDTPEEITSLLTENGLTLVKQFETEFAVIFTAVV